MSFTIVLTITCIISIVYRGVKKGFQPQDLSQQVHLLSCHIRCHPKTFIPSICCICKTQRASCCCMAAIRSGLTRSATFSTSNVSLLSVLSSTCFQDQRCIDIILIAPKYILQIEHTRFFKSTLTTWLNASCGIPRGYFLRTHVGIRPLMGIVWCNDSYWLVLSDLVHINPLSRLKRHRMWRWQKHFLYNIFAWWPKRPINNM